MRFALGRLLLYNLEFVKLLLILPKPTAEDLILPKTATREKPLTMSDETTKNGSKNAPPK
jgi:hypothetical protein